jgi:hypothetical protein
VIGVRGPGSWQTGRGVTTVLLSPSNLLATIGDPDGTRTVTSIIALLVALGLTLAMIATWLHRTTRPDPELLAPLEVMGERKWRRADPVAQRRTLDAVRPEAARPLDPSVAPPTFDEAFDAGPSAGGFDDLHADAADDTEAAVGAAAAGVPAGFAPPVGESTPRQIDRPDGFSDEFDSDALAAAAAELEIELQHRPGSA